MPSLPRSIAAFLVLLLLIVAAAPAGAAQPRAEQGRIDLPAVLQQPSALQGEWGFAWQEFVDPHWKQLPAQSFAPVPASWNELAADGKPPGPDGWGSYVLQVDCPAGSALAVEAVGQRTASRLFVNGELVAAHGDVGASAQASRAAVHTRIPVSREFACPLRITLHVSNFEHRAGGFVRPLAAAPADLLARERERRVVYATTLLATYLLTAVVALIFFLVRPRERVALVYGLFSVAMAVYTDMIGERLLLRPLSGRELGWVPYMRVEYLAWIASMALFLLTLRGLFPNEIHRRFAQAVVATLGVAAAAVVVLPPAIYSHVAVPGQAIAVGVALYVAAAILRARRRAPVDAGILLAGMLAILLTLAIDLLLIDAPRPDTKFQPVGFALFLLSPAVVIARRLSQALNAEERSRTLEENARLREDVERMSRHDLKTPLNSILGVTRLLRDDGHLGAEQRELVGVLQRAALRMLEMVNLSLGLFRMETGTYDFQPQAVDLREVVGRVLVDLHSLAESSGVTVYLEGSDRKAVYVRAEELLCYSIVANLVKNAVEASRRGEHVSLVLRAGDPVSLTVTNPGEVPPELTGRFFEKYATAGKSGGTGLGTYSARLMARAQQGDLHLRTGPMKGTSVTLTLQAMHEEPAPALPARAEAPAADWVSGMPARTVLVAEDDEYLRLVMRRFLPSPPFEVQTAPNGQAASEAMVAQWPDYLLVDMEMPLKDGIETVRWVRQFEAMRRLPRCRVLMLSGNDDEATAARALEAGADRFLPKPVSREALLSTLRGMESGEPAPGGEAPQPGTPRPPAPPEAEEVVPVNPEWLEFFPGFLRSQRETVESMARALAADDRKQMQFLAHRATGGLATLGLHWAARQSREVEQGALNASAEHLQQRIVALREHLARVRFEPA
ncbi:MAG TPA: response regulator [Ramlibacter sp.]|nr:response regulator [Ramlibacter sp.]